ncbi:hypothetical protein [Streptomyces sp. NBC_00145]|uniref:hypothetical protein n=1 Tax=Streptomyces sp. NBC_00145 TaxID=2975666 RepID=UPI002E199655
MTLSDRQMRIIRSAREWITQYAEAGDAAGAADATADLLADSLRVLGPDHPDTLNARNNRASWRGEAGDAAGAADALACCAGERGLACGPLSRWWGVRAEFCSLSRAGDVRYVWK